MFIFNEKEFETGFVREVFDNRYSSASRIRQSLKKQGFPFACVIPSADKSKLFVSYGPNDQQYDYAAFVYDQLRGKVTQDAIIIEAVERGRYFVLRIKNGVFNSDKLLSEEHMLSEAYKVYKYQKDTQDTQLIFLGQPNDQVSAMIERFAEPVYFDSLLPLTRSTQKRGRDSIERFRLKSIKDALAVPGVAQPKVKRTWAAIIIAATIGTFLIAGDEPVSNKLRVIDPYEDLKVLLTAGAINPVGRMKQDYNMQIALLGLPGWNLISVDHMETMSSYEVQQVSRGTIGALDRFAAENGLTVAKLVTGYQIVVPGLNKPIHDMPRDDVYMHDLQNVTDVFISAVETYVPRIGVAIQKDQKNANKDWGRRQIVVSFAGHYKEDLLTIAHIIESLQLPVAFDSANYRFEDEKLSGNLILTIIGKVDV